MGTRESDPSRSDKLYEYIPRSPKTATKVHKVRRYELLEEELEKEIEEAVLEFDSSADRKSSDK